MTMAYLALTALLALIAAFSALMKIRRDPNVVKIIHEIVGVPMKFFPALAACELAGALGVVIGIWYPVIGVAAGAGLVIYFLGAVVSHLRAGDLKGIGPAIFVLAIAIGGVALRVAAM
jgi:DoxX-like protein